MYIFNGFSGHWRLKSHLFCLWYHILCSNKSSVPKPQLLKRSDAGSCFCCTQGSWYFLRGETMFVVFWRPAVWKQGGAAQSNKAALQIFVSSLCGRLDPQPLGGATQSEWLSGDRSIDSTIMLSLLVIAAINLHPQLILMNQVMLHKQLQTKTWRPSLTGGWGEKWSWGEKQKTCSVSHT